jgi:hypothetical protein
MAQLVRREPVPDTRLGRDSAELGADGCARPRAPAGGTIDDAQQRSDWQIDACGQPRAQVFPAPLVHPDLAAAAALAAADQDRPAPVIEVVLGERKRLLDAQSGTPKHHDHRSQPPPVPVLGGVAYHRDDLIDGGRVSRITDALVARRAARVIPGHGRRRTAPPGCIEP